MFLRSFKSKITISAITVRCDKDSLRSIKDIVAFHTGHNFPPSGVLKVHKIENFFDSDFGICVISLLVMHK